MGDKPEQAEPVNVPAPEGAGPDELLTAALAAAQAEFPVIAKTLTARVPTKNGGEYTYTYADLADVLNAVRPILARHGLAVTQPTTKDGLLVTRIRHVAGGVIESEVMLGQSPSSPQAFGGALTYLRRYELTTLLGIAAEDDRDAQDVPTPSSKPEREPLPPWATPADDARKRELVALVSPFIGADRAKALGKGIADSFGYVPDGVVAAFSAFAAHHGAVERAAAQDREAETPPPSSDPLHGMTGPDGELGTDREPEEHLDAQNAAAEAADVEAEQKAELDDDRPAAGTVPVPDVTGLSAEDAFAELRSAGCTCPDPMGEGSKSDDCPLVGHGIPF